MATIREKHQLDRIERKLDAIMRGEVFLARELIDMSAELDTLKAEVAHNTDVEQSAIALIQGLKAQLDAAGTDPVALKALSDQLGANAEALAAAVAANTPTAPEQPAA